MDACHNRLEIAVNHTKTVHGQWTMITMSVVTNFHNVIDLS